jgi:hypothetical protein
MSEEVLLNSLPALQSAKTFEELHRVILNKIGDIQGIGELTVYDIAVRIGAELNLAPAVVFLHAGTRIGAKALGLDVSQKFIAAKVFLLSSGLCLRERLKMCSAFMRTACAESHFSLDAKRCAGYGQWKLLTSMMLELFSSSWE